MPQIPKQYNRRLLPTASGGGGATRNVAAKATGGQAIGAALAGGAAGVASAFQDAQRRRDAINAHLDSLEQQATAAKESYTATAKMREDVDDLNRQVQEQGDIPWKQRKVKIWNEAGDEQIEVGPDDGMQILLQRRMDTAINNAEEFGGKEAKARVAEAVSRDGAQYLSKYRDGMIKMRHDKELADFQVVANRLEDQAADPSNRFREIAKQDLDDHITSGIKAGIFSPTDGVKLKETMKDSIADKWATQTALRDPVAFLKMVNETQAKGEAGPDAATGGINATTGKLAKLPEDIRPEKMAHYTAIAFGQLQHQQAEIDRKNKAAEAQTKMIHEQTYRDKMARVLSGESVSGELPQSLNENQMPADQAHTTRTVEHSLQQQDRNNPALIEASKVKLFGYTKDITKAKFGVGNIDDLESQITADLEAGNLRAEEAQSALGQLREAQGHLVSEAQHVQNQTVQAAHKNMMGALTTSGPLDKYDALSEQAKEGADRDFWDLMRKNPNGDPWEMREKVMKRWEPVIAERKNVMGEATQVKLDDAKLDSMVQRGALSKAGAKAVRERQENEKGRKIVSDFLSTYKPPEPTIWEKMKNLGQVGSSWFQEADAGATE